MYELSLCRMYDLCSLVCIFRNFCCKLRNLQILRNLDSKEKYICKLMCITQHSNKMFILDISNYIG